MECIFWNCKKMHFLRNIHQFLYILPTTGNKQKQPSRIVVRNRWTENKKQIYRRTPIRRCEFNKVLYWNRTSAWVFSSKFAAYFQNTTPFPKNTSGRLILYKYRQVNWRKTHHYYKYREILYYTVLCRIIWW